MKTILTKLHMDLQNHKIYSSIQNREDLQTFMKWHAFAVWDFMSLLKSLQNEITCTKVPWRPSAYPKDLVRFINEIVVGEESDSDGNGAYIDHFTMYLNAMNEIGAQTNPVQMAIEKLDFSDLPAAVSEFVNYNLELAKNSKIHEVAAAFFYGRENLVPSIFAPMVREIEQKRLDCPNFLYYLKRHIELDGEEHGELARKCLDILIGSDKQKEVEAIEAAKKSLELRNNLWNFINLQITE